LGRCKITPIVKSHLIKENPSKLEWFPIVNGKENAGELLACFELFQIDKLNPKNLPESPPKIGSIYRVPNTIRPELKRTMIEVVKIKSLPSCKCIQITFANYKM